MTKITPFLWFANQAEEAAKYYVSIFRNSKIINTNRYGKEGFEIHKMPEGTVMSIDFDLDGQQFTALNGGPVFQINEAISFQVFCETQEENNYFWKKLTTGGDEKAQQCGWLKDKFGVSWQIVPIQLGKYINGPDKTKSQRAMKAMLQMKQIDINKIKDAYDGK
jgi:predicted 3-demethylubiquinone-9 3-methyltransferase (glyoxalase superfamily)